jgi:branched-chain amino acid transport system ATP-binding protein
MEPPARSAREGAGKLMLKARASARPLLSVKALTITFGGVHAVENVSFDARRGEITSLIGPNGAGKTTVLNGISGFVRCNGSILFEDVQLMRQPAYRRASLGIGRTFQNLQLFGSMTLLDNVLAGQHAQMPGNMLMDIARIPVLARERAARERARAVLTLMGIERYADRRVDTLPFGIQKLAGVARAVAIRPRLLLLDEPGAGLNRQESTDLGVVILGLKKELGLAILLVEHNMRLVVGVSDRVVVLDSGRKVTEGSPQDVTTNPLVIEAYLGSTELVQQIHGFGDTHA